MKYFYIFLFSFSLYSLAAQQTITGTVLDASTNEPLLYVNIGIPLKNIGTVSDQTGNFTLKIKEENLRDTLRFSYLGYETQDIPISELSAPGMTITLAPKNFNIKEIVVSSTKMQTKVVGNKLTGKFVSAGLGGNFLGHEVGTLIKIKKRPTLIKNFRVHINRNPYGKIKFRLNIYSVKGENPDVSVLKENIIVEFEKKSGFLEVDLTPYHVMVEDDFIIALEWIENYGEDSILFSAGFFRSPVKERSTSHGRWNTVRPIAIGFHAEIGW